MESLPPPKFKPSANLAADWRNFHEEFDLWLQAVDISSEGADAQCIALLLISMGKEYRTVFTNSLVITEENKKKYAEVVKAFTNYFEPQKIRKGYITEFLNRKQGQNETVTQYITALRDLGSRCNFAGADGTGLNEQLCVAISNGVRDMRLREKLWSTDMSLDEIVKKCQLWEQKEQTKTLYSSGAEASYEVHAVRGRQNNRGGSRQKETRGRNYGNRSQRGSSQHGSAQRGAAQRGAAHATGTTHATTQQYDGNQRKYGTRTGTQNQNEQWIDSCSRCGRSHAKNRCPAYGRLCNICHKQNHFAKVCKNKTAYCVQDRQESMSDSEYAYQYEVVQGSDTDEETQHKFVWCNEVVGDTHEKHRNWSVQLGTPGGENITFKIDTAADVSVISNACYQSLNVKPPIKPGKCKIFGLGQQRVVPVGEIDLACAHKGKQYTVMCEVIDGKVPNLLSLHDSVRMGLVKRVDAVSKSELPKSVRESTPKSVSSIIDEFADVFEGIGKVPGEVSLKVDPNITPVAHPPRPVPVALRDKVQLKLRELEQQDIIERIPAGTPTPWCSALHVVPKKNGSVRLTMDPKDLNGALLREYHPSTTVEDVAQRCGQASYFTVLDANQGYFQLQLDEGSKNYTAFNTPFGRYRYKRLPMGITSAPELFQRAFGDIFADIDRLESIMDDFLIAAETVEEHNTILRETLQRARDNNVTFSLEKLQLCKSEVMYSGHKFTKDGLQMDQEKIRAIVGMPEPESIADIERLIGMVTYVGKYLKHLSSVTEPLRELIKESKETGFRWHFEQVHKEAFQRLKQMMTHSPVLKFYDRQEPIVISCDASQSGLGCVLLQSDSPVAYGSKALTTAEYAYAQIEKELLAIVFSFKKFHTYVYGRNDITVETDHLPLIRIFQKPLHQVPLRLQKMRMKLQGYDFKLVAKKGTEIPVADALSRAFLKDSGPNLTGGESHIFTVTTEEVTSATQMSPPRLEEIRRETAKDSSLQAVMDVINAVEGWPSARSQADPAVRPYFDFQEELSIIEGIVYKGERVVIPTKMRKKALEMLHASHQGIVKTKQLARDLVYWPGINKQIEDMVSRCSPCQERRNTQVKEPLCPMPIPTRPWEHVAEDLFDCLGHKWLICVDYYSEYFEMEKMEFTDGDQIIRQTKKWVSGHGIPDQITTDNGPPWNGGAWKDFADQFGFKHNTISPKHSQTNGMVEKTVGIAKNMLLKCQASGEDPYLALLNIRNTPRDDTTGSPAQRLFSRRTATKLPTAKKKLLPQVKTPTEVSRKLREDRHIKAKKYYDRGSKPLKSLHTGDTIRVRVGKTWQPALLMPEQPLLPPRSYQIQMPSGRQTRRNRRDLLLSRESNIYRRPWEDDLDLDMQEFPEEPFGLTEPEHGVTQATFAPPNVPTPSSNPPLGRAQLGTMPNGNSNYGNKPPVVTRSGRISRPPAKLKDYEP